MSMLFTLLLIGFGVGCVSALLGIGGGVLLVPLLPLITDWSQHQVVAVSLFVIMGNSLANLISFHRQGLVNWSVLKFWGPAAGLGSFCGSYLALQVSGKSLKVVLLVVIALMLIRSVINFIKGPLSQKIFVTSDWTSFKGVWGFFVGILSGFAGVGTGLISNILFMSRGWVKKDELAPTGNGVMFFVGLFSVVSFLLFGQNQELNFSFFKNSIFELSLLMFSVLLSSLFFRPLNPMLTQGLRFSALTIILITVFCYVFVGII